MGAYSRTGECFRWWGLVKRSRPHRGKGRAVLERALDRYLALIRDLELHYAPQEVPGIDGRNGQPPLGSAFDIENCREAIALADIGVSD